MDASRATNGLFFVWVEDAIAPVGEVEGDLHGSALLARSVAFSNERISARDVRESYRSVDATRRIAPSLLRHALSNLATAKAGPAARELWAAAEAAFQRVADDREGLARFATTLGIDDASAAAKEVSAAIKSELLPVIHAMAAYVAEDPAREAFHRARISQWHAPTGTPLAVILSAWQGKILGRARAALDKSLTAIALRHYGELQPRDGRAAARVASEVGERLARLDSVAPDVVAAAGVALERWPFDFRGRIAVAASHVFNGVAQTRVNDYAAAALEFARASAVNPFDSQLVDLIDKCAQAQTRLADQLRDLARSGQPLNFLGRMLLDADTGAAGRYLESAEADAQRKRTLDVLVSQLAARLGLDPGQAAHTAAALAVCETCGALGAEQPIQDALDACYRLHPVLHQADLQGLRWVAENRPSSWIAAALGLPPLPPLDEAPLDAAHTDALLERLKALGAAVGVSRRRLSFYRWAFAPLDRGYKTLAVVGIVGLLTGGTLGLIRGYHAHRRDLAYAALGAAANSGNDPAVLRAAGEFLDHTRPGFEDYRISEVTTSYQRKLLRQLLAASHRSDTKAVETLLSRTSALQAWITNDQSTKRTP